MIKDSLYKAFTSQINFVNFLDGMTETVEGETDFELLDVMYSGFLYTMLFEDYFTVKGETVSTLLTDVFVEKLIGIIAKKSESGYTFGEEKVNLGYKTKELALYKIRNKMAHGDFYVEDGNIIFEEKGVKGIINLLSFNSMLCKLETYGDENKKYNENHKFIYINKNTVECKVTKKNIDNIANNIFQVRISDKPLNLCIRNNDYVTHMSSFIELNKNYLQDKYKVKSKSKISIEEYEKVFSLYKVLYKEDHGIDLSCSIEPITKLPEYEEIKEKFLNRIRKMPYLNMGARINILSHIVYGMENENRIGIRKSILLAINILDVLNKNPNLTVEGVMNVLSEDISRLIIICIDDILLMSYLVGFYSLFQYGLETSLTRCNERKVYEIYNNSKFDFSKLNMEALEVKNRVNEINMLDLSYPKEKVKKMKTAENTHAKLAAAYGKVVIEHGENSDTALKLKEKFIESFKLYDSEKREMAKDIENYSDFILSFDSKKYLNNLDIIYHVRNAISHGNIRIVKYGENDFDTVIRIIDKTCGRKGDIVYDKELTVDEFVGIFSENNIKVLYEFLEVNTESREVIEKDYLKKLAKRIMVR